MKKLSCKDMGAMDDCTFVAEGETAEDVKNQMFAHAAEAHAEMLNAMTDQQKGEAMALMDRLLA